MNQLGEVLSVVALVGMAASLMPAFSLGARVGFGVSAIVAALVALWLARRGG